VYFKQLKWNVLSAGAPEFLLKTDRLLLATVVGESKVSQNGGRKLNFAAHDVIFDHNNQF
jgi:hypothetical protein